MENFLSFDTKAGSPAIYNDLLTRTLTCDLLGSESIWGAPQDVIGQTGSCLGDNQPSNLSGLKQQRFISHWSSISERLAEMALFIVVIQIFG